MVALIIKQGETQTLYFVETDPQGSILGLLNPNGTYVEKYSYDAWGRRRNPDDWSFNSVQLPTLTDRGYTGHEHLDKFNLININGRMYDPYVGRFLGVDPDIQSPDNSQNFNGYGYCLNNPLKYSDPSGMVVMPKTNLDAYNSSVNAIDSYFGMMCSMNMPEFGLVSLSWSFDPGGGGGGGVNGLINAINNFLSSDCNYGGSWSSTDGPHEFGCGAEAFFAGAIELEQNNFWGKVVGSASSFEDACARYSKAIFEQKLVASLYGGVGDLENNKPWMDVAIREIGQKEVIADPSDPTKEIINPRVQQYFTDGGFSGDPITTAWCAIFVNYCLQNAGIRGTGSDVVSSFLYWQGGKIIADPSFGAIAVYRGHVGFVIGLQGNNVILLGGNQGNMVKVSVCDDYACNKVIHYVYPEMYVPDSWVFHR